MCIKYSLPVHPQSLQIIFSGKVRRHGVMSQPCSRSGMGYHVPEIFMAQFTAITGTQHPTTSFQTAESKSNQVSVMGFHTEYAPVSSPGKCGRVQNNTVESTALPGKTFQPMQGVPLAKKLTGWINTIEFKIFPCPLQTGLSQIQRGCLCSSQGGINGKSPCISKGIQDPHACFTVCPHLTAMIPLIQKNPLRVPGRHIYLKPHRLFHHFKLKRQLRTGNLNGSGFLILFQAFMKNRMFQRLQFISQHTGNETITSGNQHTISQLVHKHIRMPVPFSVNHTENIRTWRDYSFLVLKTMTVGTAHGTASLRDLPFTGNGKFLNTDICRAKRQQRAGSEEPALMEFY